MACHAFTRPKTLKSNQIFAWTKPRCIFAFQQWLGIRFRPGVGGLRLWMVNAAGHHWATRALGRGRQSQTTTPFFFRIVYFVFKILQIAATQAWFNRLVMTSCELMQQWHANAASTTDQVGCWPVHTDMEMNFQQYQSPEAHWVNRWRRHHFVSRGEVSPAECFVAHSHLKVPASRDVWSSNGSRFSIFSTFFLSGSCGTSGFSGNYFSGNAAMQPHIIKTCRHKIWENLAFSHRVPSININTIGNTSRSSRGTGTVWGTSLKMSNQQPKVRTPYWCLRNQE
jgi:hypothetical protein